MRKFLSILILLTLLHVSSASAVDFNELQPVDTNHKQIITTFDGSVMIGRIEKVENSVVYFITDNGTIEIKTLNIKSIRVVPVNQIKNGVVWFENPNQTRLFLAPTARTLKQGQGYFSDTYIFFPGVAYGLTNNFTIGGGASIFPGVDWGDQLYYLTAKVGLQSQHTFHLAADLIVFNLPEDDPEFGVLFLMGTIGEPDKNLTAGLGYGFYDGDWADQPSIIFGGEYRLSRRLSFVTENWLLPGGDDDLLFSYGFRLMGEKTAVDLAFFNVADEDIMFPGVPYLDFVFNF